MALREIVSEDNEKNGFFGSPFEVKGRKKMGKAAPVDMLDSLNKRYLGELKIGKEGAVFTGSGTRQAGSKVGEMKDKPGTPPPVPTEAFAEGGKKMGEVARKSDMLEYGTPDDVKRELSSPMPRLPSLTKESKEEKKRKMKPLVIPVMEAKAKKSMNPEEQKNLESKLMNRPDINKEKVHSVVSYRGEIGDNEKQHATGLHRNEATRLMHNAAQKNPDRSFFVKRHGMHLEGVQYDPHKRDPEGSSHPGVGKMFSDGDEKLPTTKRAKIKREDTKKGEFRGGDPEDIEAKKEEKEAQIDKGILSTEKRADLKISQFAVPKKKAEEHGTDVSGEAKGAYPIHDLAHAKNALARVSQHGSPEEQEMVKRKVYAKYPELKESYKEREGKDPITGKEIEKGKELLDKMLGGPMGGGVVGGGGGAMSSGGARPPMAMGVNKSLEGLMAYCGSVSKADDGDDLSERQKFHTQHVTHKNDKIALAHDKAIDAIQHARSVGRGGPSVSSQKAKAKAIALSDRAKEIHNSENTMEKAITARSLPRPSAPMIHEMIRRNAQNVMTRGNSRFAGMVGGSPLYGEIVQEAYSEEQSGRQSSVVKSCDSCGRSYTLFKGIDEGCPTCSVNKSLHCHRCGKFLVKSHSGSSHCPVCG
jgi:hypothetical protein